jgi:hypothetical protein
MNGPALVLLGDAMRGLADRRLGVLRAASGKNAPGRVARKVPALAKGGGSFTADGTMIDIPVIDRAHRLLARHDAIERWFRKA